MLHDHQTAKYSRIQMIACSFICCWFEWHIRSVKFKSDSQFCIMKMCLHNEFIQSCLTITKRSQDFCHENTTCMRKLRRKSVNSSKAYLIKQADTSLFLLITAKHSFLISIVHLIFHKKYLNIFETRYIYQRYLLVFKKVKYIFSCHLVSLDNIPQTSSIKIFCIVYVWGLISFFLFIYFLTLFNFNLIPNRNNVTRMDMSHIPENCMHALQ